MLNGEPSPEEAEAKAERDRLAFIMDQVEPGDRPNVIWSACLRVLARHGGGEAETAVMRFPVAFFGLSDVLRAMDDKTSLEDDDTALKNLVETLSSHAVDDEEEEGEEEEGEVVIAVGADEERVVNDPPAEPSPADDDDRVSPDADLREDEFASDDSDDEDSDEEVPVLRSPVPRGSPHFRSFDVDVTSLPPFPGRPLPSISSKKLVRLLTGRHNSLNPHHLLDYFVFFLKLKMYHHAYATCCQVSKIRGLKLFMRILNAARELFDEPAFVVPRSRKKLFRPKSGFTLALLQLLKSRLAQVRDHVSKRKIVGEDLVQFLHRVKLASAVCHPDFRDRISRKTRVLQFREVVFLTLKELHRTRAFCDVKLLSAIEGQETRSVRGHLAILVWKLPALHSLLSFGGLERLELEETGCLTIHNFPVDVLFAVFDYTYRGGVASTDLEILTGLFQFAKVFAEFKLLRLVKERFKEEIEIISQKKERNSIIEAISVIDQPFAETLFSVSNKLRDRELAREELALEERRRDRQRRERLHELEQRFETEGFYHMGWWDAQARYRRLRSALGLGPIERRDVRRWTAVTDRLRLRQQQLEQGRIHPRPQ